MILHREFPAHIAELLGRLYAIYRPVPEQGHQEEEMSTRALFNTIFKHCPSEHITHEDVYLFLQQNGYNYVHTSGEFVWKVYIKP